MVNNGIAARNHKGMVGIDDDGQCRKQSRHWSDCLLGKSIRLDHCMGEQAELRLEVPDRPELAHGVAHNTGMGSRSDDQDSWTPTF